MKLSMNNADPYLFNNNAYDTSKWIKHSWNNHICDPKK